MDWSTDEELSSLCLFLQVMFSSSFLSSAVEKRAQRRCLEEDWLKKRAKVDSKTDVSPSPPRIYRHNLYRLAARYFF